MAVPAVFANQKADGTTLAGSIRWGDFKIQYLGTTYTIPAGATTMRWMWWRYNGGGANSYIEAGADIPVDLKDDDIVILGNKSGIPFRIQSSQLLDGDLIVDGSIGAAAIAAGSISADKMAVKIATIDDLTSGFVMAGRITVGTSFWSKSEGIVIPQLDGGTITLPSDGSAATITAHITAKSLTVQNNLNISGSNNKLAGQLVLSNGVTAPTAPPSVSQTWPSVPAVDTVYLGPISYGAATNLLTPTEVVIANAFYGATIASFHKDTGAAGIGLVSTDRPWFANFNPTGGVTTLGSGSTGNYYVLGFDTSRSDNWYIYRLDSNFNKISEVFVAQKDWIPPRPIIGNDGQNVMWAHSGTSTITVYRVGPDLGAPIGGKRQKQFLSMTNLFSSPLCFIGEGVYDFGASRLVVGVANGNFFYPHTPNTALETLVRNETELWPAANGGNVRGALFIDGRFEAHDTDGRWSSYSQQRAAVTVTGSYTWYDGVGTTRETQASPSTSLALSARAWVKVETPPPPDNGVASGNPDKANRVGIYLATAANARRLQSYLAVDGSTFIATRTYMTDLIGTGGATEPSSNGFNGAVANSPGTILSADGTRYLNGDGTAMWPGIEPVGRMNAYLSANIAIPTSTATQVTWTAMDPDNLGVSWNATNKEFTILTAGTYMIDLSAFFVFSAATVVGYCWINVALPSATSVTVARGQGYSSNTLLSISATDLRYLPVGSKVAAFVQQNGSGNQNLGGGATRETAMRIARISA
jgi:hypothetical protein